MLEWLNYHTSSKCWVKRPVESDVSWSSSDDTAQNSKDSQSKDYVYFHFGGLIQKSRELCNRPNDTIQSSGYLKHNSCTFIVLPNLFYNNQFAICPNQWHT